jgi:hypothetical protein
MKKTFLLKILVALSFFLATTKTHMTMAQWNSNTSVNTLISDLGVADMQTAATSDGKMWVAYYSNTSGNYDMYAQLFDADGNKLLGPNGFLVSNQVSGSAIYVFNVCLDASNNLIIGCQDQRSGSNQCVLYKISQAGAHLWSSTGIVLGAGLSPYQTVLTTGEVISAFNATSGSTLNLQKVKTDGTLAWATPKPILVGTTKTTRGQLVPAPDGKFTMVFQKKGVGIGSTLYAQKYDSAGNSLYTAVQISTQTSSQARYYSILAHGDTTFFGYYVSQGARFNSFLQRINPDGTLPWGTNGSNFNTSVASTDNYQQLTNIASSPTSPYVWSVCSFSNTSQSTYGVYIQKFLRTTGARQFGDGAKVVFPITADRDQQAGGLVLIDDTPMFMEYDVNYKIYATRLDANGDFGWPVTRVEISSTTAGGSTPKGRFGFTAAGSNKCAGYWYENRGASVGYQGFAQGISRNGLVGIDVMTQGNVPAVITTMGGTLQMMDTIYPLTANQAVIWSLIPGTGMASISPTGLVTASSDGTVWAKATAVADNTMSDSLLITISGQTPPECNAPSSVNASQIMSVSALIRWLPADPLPSGGYIYEVRTSGNPGSGNTGLTTSGTTLPGVDSVALAGLTGGTTYYVYLRSDCGDGNFSEWTSALSFTTLPVNITLAGSVSESHAYCYNATGTITVAGGGTTFTVFNGGSATMIAGVNILYLPGTTVETGGYMHGYISVDNQYCQTPSNPLVTNLMPDESLKMTVQKPVNDTRVVVYPNPSPDQFTLSVFSNINNGNLRVLVSGMHGSVIKSFTTDGLENVHFSLGDQKPGIYILKVTASNGWTSTLKLVKL